MGPDTDNDKKLAGKITTNENDEESRVDLSVYWHWIRYCGGGCGLLCMNLTMCVFIVSKVTTDWLVGEWAASPSQ